MKKDGLIMVVILNFSRKTVSLAPDFKRLKMGTWYEYGGDLLNKSIPNVIIKDEIKYL